MDLQTGFDAFQSIRSAVKPELNWRSAGPVRDATALALLPLADGKGIDYEQLKHAAQVLKQNHSRLHFLRSSIRYAIAATLLTGDHDPVAFTTNLSAGRKIWRDLKLRRTSPYEGASLITILLGGATIDHGSLSTLKSAFDRLKTEYYWHVGSYTLPPLAMALQFGGNALTDGAVLFGELRKRKFPSQYAMSASLIGSIADRSPNETADWMITLHSALNSQRLSDAARHTTGIALASLTEVPAKTIAEEVAAYHKQFKNGPFNSSRAGALSLNFVNTIRIANTKNSHRGNDVTPLASVISALQAYIVVQQQSAATAAIVGGVVATTAGS